MTNFQLYQQISALPFHLKQDVIDFIEKINNTSPSSGVSNYELINYLPNSYLMEPEVDYNSKKPFIDLLLNGPTFTEKQIQKVINSRNS